VPDDHGGAGGLRVEFATGSRSHAYSCSAAFADPTAPEVVVQPSLTPQRLCPRVASPTPTYTPAPPTETPTPTETPGPYVHIIKQNETLGYIIQLYGYRDFSIIPEIVSLNNLPNADTLPGEGSQLLIPRQTPTPLPVGMELTVAADATRGTTTRGCRKRELITCYTVQEGDTIVGIAEEYGTTIERLSQLNHDTVNWFGCDFSNYSGGPDCNPNIQVGQCINVPAPTPTPTLSPTPSGSETPTLTPTFAPPVPVYPPEGGIAPAIVVRLHWVGVVSASTIYLVQVTDVTMASRSPR
jgi:hypothetical protein